MIAIGTNRRYADTVDRQTSDRVLQRTASQGTLQTLTRAELQLDMLPCTTDPRPRAVRAWVRFGATPVQVDAEACMWTSRAVAIRFDVGAREYRCWVWASAVESRGEVTPSLSETYAPRRDPW